MNSSADPAMPKGYRESYKGFVPAWECDNVEHFTVAFYFDRLERATARFLLDAGLDANALSTITHRDFYVRYAREFRAGSVFMIQTGIISRQGAQLHLGHRVVDVVNGQVCTTIEHILDGAAIEQINASDTIDWDGPARDTRLDVPDDGPWLSTGTDIVMPGELDWSERYRPSAVVHRFSSAGSHLMARFGWTPAYEDDNRIGFSTFEFQLRLADLPGLAAPLDMQGCVAHLGRSSVHIVHRIVAPGSGNTLAVLHQLGVHLDKDARRPSPIPETIKAAAQSALVSAD